MIESPIFNDAVVVANIPPLLIWIVSVVGDETGRIDVVGVTVDDVGAVIGGVVGGVLTVVVTTGVGVTIAAIVGLMDVINWLNAPVVRDAPPTLDRVGILDIDLPTTDVVILLAKLVINALLSVLPAITVVVND